jgi:hypothetical protein
MDILSIGMPVFYLLNDESNCKAIKNDKVL